MNLQINHNVLFVLSLFLLIIACKSSEPFSKKDVKSASKVIGVDFNEDRVDAMHIYLKRNRTGYEKMREFSVGNEVFPALMFDPLPGGFSLPEKEACKWHEATILTRPDSPADIAYLSISELGHLLETKQLTSVELTQIYLDRIKKYDPSLLCVITLLEEQAMTEAKKADTEIASGIYRGVLHGIPYGVKDLVSVENTPTTWGAKPYKEQTFEHTATIVKKLRKEGAVLLAKLTSGSLARGDVWFGGKTRNPWDVDQGASGSSAGSGSATSAGLVAFSIGTETLGSITSPSTRNGVTGLRPTYGRVSRDGVMSLSWSMDKVGPICRSAADCAIVFEAIQGSDLSDPSTYDVNFCFSTPQMPSLRVGYLSDLATKDTTASGRNVRAAVEVIKGMNIGLQADSLPSDYPFPAFDIILRAEAGAFFDDLVRSGGVDDMVQQDVRSRANSLRQSRLIPAVEYIQANRYRRLLIEDMDVLMQKYDVLITPTFGGTQLITTNLTGHPVVTVPCGFDENGRPTSISFLGNLFEEEKILAFAKAFQEATDWEEKRPPLDDQIAN